MIALERHPASRSGVVQRISAAATRDGGRLAFRYVIEGRLEAVRLPARGLRPLWQHTCCEAFVGATASAAYREFNFSPSGDWAAHAFNGYRDGRPIDVPDPGIAVRSTREMLELSASVGAMPGPLRIALAAVVEEQDGTLSYWALRHPPGKPDFHHGDGFALELA